MNVFYENYHITNTRNTILKLVYKKVIRLTVIIKTTTISSKDKTDY